MRHKLKRPSPATIIALIALVAALSGTAIASIPGKTGAINACYANSGGALRVIDFAKGQGCKSTETRLSWQQTGPTGPPGQAGAAGPTGPRGEDGSRGPTGDVGAAGTDAPTSIGTWSAQESVTSATWTSAGTTTFQYAYSPVLEGSMKVTVGPNEILTAAHIDTSMTVSGPLWTPYPDQSGCNYNQAEGRVEFRFAKVGAVDPGYWQPANEMKIDRSSPVTVTERKTIAPNVSSGEYRIEFRLVAYGGDKQNTAPYPYTAHSVCGTTEVTSDRRKVWFEVGKADNIQNIDQNTTG
jgi:hypothetical protein